MFKWARSVSLVMALAGAASGRAAAEVPDPPKASAGGAQTAERYISETGADLAALDSHFQKYREAAEKLSALYAKLADSQSQLLPATKQMQETQMSFNLQYLQLLSHMQNEIRSYTAVSKIMKTKHDTVKNSISNVR